CTPSRAGRTASYMCPGRNGHGEWRVMDFSARLDDLPKRAAEAESIGAGRGLGIRRQAQAVTARRSAAPRGGRSASPALLDEGQALGRYEPAVQRRRVGESVGDHALVVVV